mmetsp:Transcript_41815/g.75927  ORF Transcript_41815/g.75927 Transcript_41815/m.75927 type:complete len:428 (-) Transcript_41815:55-1338(-)
MASWLFWLLSFAAALCGLSHEDSPAWPHSPLERAYVVYLDEAPQDRWNATLKAVVAEVGVTPFAEYYMELLATQRAQYPDVVQFYEAHLAEFQAVWEERYYDLLMEIYALSDILQEQASTTQEQEACSRDNIFLAMMHMQIGNIGVQECTSVVLRQHTGEVLHFRNWDFRPLPDMLGKLSVQIEFAHSSNRTSAGFRCLIALTHIHKWTTCMKPGNFSMSLNARYTGPGTERGRAPEQELAMLKAGRLPRVAILRNVMQAASYESALNVASTAPALTSMYVILAAPKDSAEGLDAQGAIVTIEGNANTSDVMVLPEKGQGWFIVQTNIDHDVPMAQDKVSSHRREHMKALLNTLGPDADAMQYYATLRNESVFPEGNSGPDDGKVFRDITIASVFMRPGQASLSDAWRADVWRPMPALIGGSAVVHV